MNYLHSKIEMELESAGFERNTPEREAFWQHMQKVIKALHDIEWVDSGDCGPGDENEAIEACLGGTDELTAITRERDALKATLDAIARHDSSEFDPGHRGIIKRVRETLRKLASGELRKP